MDNELRDEIKTLQNMMARIMKDTPYNGTTWKGRDGTWEHIIKQFRPKTQPKKDLKWKDTKEYVKGK